MCDSYADYHISDFPDLSFSDDAVSAIRSLLENDYGFEPSNIIALPDATLTQVEAAFDELKNRVMSGEISDNDLLVVYLTAHGRYAFQSYPDSYFLATASDPDNPPDPNYFDILYVSDSFPGAWGAGALDLREELEDAGVAGTRQVVIVDACESAGAILAGLTASQRGILRTVLTAVDAEHGTPAGPFHGWYDGSDGPLFAHFLVDNALACPAEDGLPCLFVHARDDYVQHMTDHCGWLGYPDDTCIGIPQYATGVDLYGGGAPLHTQTVTGNVCYVDVVHDIPPAILASTYVNFFVDGVERFVDSQDPYVFPWNIATESPGNHSVRADVIHPAYGEPQSGFIATRTVSVTVEAPEHAPVLSDAEVAANGVWNERTFTVFYTDADDDAPDYVHAAIDGGEAQPLDPAVPGDTGYTDGAVFTGTFCCFGQGWHYGHFEAASHGQLATDVPFSFHVQEPQPSSLTLTATGPVAVDGIPCRR